MKHKQYRSPFLKHAQEVGIIVARKFFEDLCACERVDDNGKGAALMASLDVWRNFYRKSLPTRNRIQSAASAAARREWTILKAARMQAKK